MNAKSVAGGHQKASFDPLTRGFTRLQIESAILFVERINYDAAYGRDSELCLASRRVLNAMQRHANDKAQLRSEAE